MPLLAYFDGTDWHSLGSSFTSNSKQVERLSFYHGYLAVGGVFTQTLGTTNWRNIALWTGRDCTKITASGTYTFYNWREPVVIEIKNPGNLAEIKVQRFNKNHPAAGDTTPNLKNGVYWKIEGLSANGQPVDGLVYSLTLPTIGFTPDEKDKICHYNPSEEKWDCAASSYNAGKKTITRSGLTTFSDFTVGDNVGPTVADMRTIRAKAYQSPYSIMFLIAVGIGCIVALKRRSFKGKQSTAFPKSQE